MWLQDKLYQSIIFRDARALVEYDMNPYTLFEKSKGTHLNLHSLLMSVLNI